MTIQKHITSYAGRGLVCLLLLLTATTANAETPVTRFFSAVAALLQPPTMSLAPPPASPAPFMIQTAGGEIGISDNFSGSALSANWTVLKGAFPVSGNSVTNDGNGGVAIYTAGSFGNDQKACVTYSTVGNGAVGPMVRADGLGNGYVVYFGDANSAQILKLIKAGGAVLDSSSGSGTISAGVPVCLSVQGSNLTLTSNGTTIATGSDSQFTSGTVGLNAAAGPVPSVITSFTASPWSSTPNAPTIYTQPVSSDARYGVAAKFTVAYSPSGNPTVQWSKAPAGSTTFTSISGATGSTYTVANPQAADNGVQYQAAITNAAGTTLSSIVTTTTSALVTWYAGPGGGTRYNASDDAKNGQCDGKSPNPYPGSGVNQHCAYANVDYFWDDHYTYGSLAWEGKGGDTWILLHGMTYRNGQAKAYNGGYGTGCWGNSYNGCGMPPIPSGGPLQHSQFLGEYYATAHIGNKPDLTKLVNDWAGQGNPTVINIQGSGFVDVEGLNISPFEHCNLAVSGDPHPCSKDNNNLSDFGNDGIRGDNHTHDVLLQDIYVHGMNSRNIHTGVGRSDLCPVGQLRCPTYPALTLNRVWNYYSAQTGFDEDLGVVSAGENTSPDGATMLWTHWQIKFAGCNEAWSSTNTEAYPTPQNDTQAAGNLGVGTCYDQDDGGVIADAFGIPGLTGQDMTFIDGSCAFNTQDCLDPGHEDQLGYHFIVNGLTCYANMAGCYKPGGGFTGTGTDFGVDVQNTLVVANCRRMAFDLPGAPSGYNSHLGSFCRAFNAISFNFTQGKQQKMRYAHNTVLSYFDTAFTIGCDGSGTVTCTDSTFDMEDNIVKGMDAPSSSDTYGGNIGGPGAFYFQTFNGGNSYVSAPQSTVVANMIRKNNVWQGFRDLNASNMQTGEQYITACPSLFQNEPSDCNLSPEVTFDQTKWDNYNFALASASPAKAAGVTVGATTDYAGNQYLVAPSVGALEYGSTSPDYTNNVGAGAVTSTPPTTTATASLAVTPATITQGSTPNIFAASLAYSSTLPTGPVTFAVDGGAAVTADCNGSTSPETCTAAVATGSLTAGAHTLTVSLAADSTYALNSGTGTLTVTAVVAATGRTFYLSPAGSDSADGLTTSTPWLTPSHTINCGDVILAAPGIYDPDNFRYGRWGKVNCPAANNVAWLKCTTFDSCVVHVPSGSTLMAMRLDQSFWGVQGWKATYDNPQATAKGCFVVQPSGNDPTQNIHHIILANNDAEQCGQSGIALGANDGGNDAPGPSSDYFAAIGNVAYMAANFSGTGSGSGVGRVRTSSDRQVARNSSLFPKQLRHWQQKPSRNLRHTVRRERVSIWTTFRQSLWQYKQRKCRWLHPVRRAVADGVQLRNRKRRAWVRE